MVGPLFENAPDFLYRLAAARPFGSRTGLLARAREIAHAMPEPLQVELVDAHPRLGAPAASVSAMSFREQGYDRDEAANLADEAARERERVAAELDRLNDAYEARFGFRYCVFVAGRSRAELLADMAAALERERERVAAELDRLNDAYEARFGFRYCVFVAGRSRAELLADMAAALERERDSELQRALDAVIDIADARSRCLIRKGI